MTLHLPYSGKCRAVCEKHAVFQFVFLSVCSVAKAMAARWMLLLEVKPLQPPDHKPCVWGSTNTLAAETTFHLGECCRWARDGQPGACNGALCDQRGHWKGLHPPHVPQESEPLHGR